MAPRSNPLPSYIGRFRVDALLGSGGMGEVYRAFDPTLKRTVAIKTVRADIDRPEYLPRLYREAQACAQLTHPNIVTVYEAGELDGVVYIAMELLAGEDLAAALRRGDLSLDARLRIFIQILDALEHAHAKGIVHRDIKPSNVYLLPDGSVKLVDFGLAHVVQAETMTGTGPVMGTPHYASPEQLKGAEVDSRSDIYSTGVLAYEAISGRRPFGDDTDSIATIVFKVISDPLPLMNVPWTQSHPALESIVARAMAKSPDERYQTAAEMRAALNAVLAGQRDVPQAPPVVPHVKSTGVWWVAAAAAVIVTLIAFQQFLGRTPRNGAVAEAPGSGPQAPASPATAADSPPPAASRSSDLPPPPAVSRADASGIAKASDTVPALPSSTPAAVLTAKHLFFGGDAANPSDAARASQRPAALNAGLRYRLIRQSPDGAEAEVDPSTEFKSGDGIRFAFESNIDGYLYVAQLGSSGRWSVLFPNPEINRGRNSIKAFERYLVPIDGWFRFDATPGIEQVFMFLSREPLTRVPGFDRPVTKLQTVEASVVNDLQRQVRSRDLVFQKDRSDTAGKAGMVSYVVNRDEVGKAVSASIELKHGQSPR